MNILRVLIVVDDPLVRTGLAAHLAEHSGVDVVGQTDAGDGLGPALETFVADVLLWDLGWEASRSLDGLAELDGAPPVLALLPDSRLSSAAWSAGARGLLARNAGLDTLVASLAVVAEGQIVLDPEAAAALVPAGERAPQPLAEELTPRELEVLGLLAEGLANRAIGETLSVTEATVKFHVNAILGKLGAQSRTDAVIRATRMGLIVT